MPKQATKTDRLLGRRIASLWRLRRLSQADLGRAVGVSFQQVQKYEKGQNRVSAEAMTIIAKLLGVSLEELFSEDDALAISDTDTTRLLGTQGALDLMRYYACIQHEQQRHEVLNLVRMVLSLSRDDRRGI